MAEDPLLQPPQQLDLDGQPISTPAPEDTPEGEQGEQSRPYERPWGLGELRDNVREWNAACDYGLLRYMQDFSNQLVNRTRELNSQIDGLMYLTQSTDTNVFSTFNKFLMLSDTQYIENVNKILFLKYFYTFFIHLLLLFTFNYT